MKRYPLVLMLEPVFQCNLACAGCGKIDPPKEILQKRTSVADALPAVDECGAPMVSIPGGEALIHKDMAQLVAAIVARRKFVHLCTNAILLSKHIDEYQPSSYLTFSIHLDGNRQRHDESVCQKGVFDKAVAAIRLARGKGFRVTVNCTLFSGEDPELFLDFLAGNQAYQCTPWSTPTYNLFGWQRPCYLLTDEGYASSFRSLMEDTDWHRYGVGRNPACDNCMAHCGFEGTAVDDAFTHPLKALKSAFRGPRVAADDARPAQTYRERVRHSVTAVAVPDATRTRRESGLRQPSELR